MEWKVRNFKCGFEYENIEYLILNIKYWVLNMGYSM